MKKTSFLVLLGAFIMVLSGCSSDYLRDDYRRPSERAAIKIPELDAGFGNHSASKMTTVKPYKPAVKNYTISSSITTVTSQDEMDAASGEVLEMGVKGQDSVEIDPYASIPESSSVKVSNASITSSVGEKSLTTTSSPAVKSLMARARADLSIGETQSAISKLERGLRIESQNPSIWHLLAKAQYDQSNHQQAITMAKKSIRYSADDKLIAQNWTLIQKSGEKSDDAIAIKEALDYFKVNP